MARTPRKWQGARNPSGLKRVRQAERRHAILQPRRSAAKTLVAKAVTVATAQPDSADVATSLSAAISALDRAAKAGAIHPNAAARRKSRLTIKINAAVGGGAVVTAGHVSKSTGKAAAAKAAKARIAAGKAVKAKGAQTAAGKARAALSKTTRAEAAPAAAPVAEAPAAKTHQGRAEGDGDQGRGCQDDHQGRAEGDGDQGRAQGDRQDDDQGRAQGDCQAGRCEGRAEDDEGREARVVRDPSRSPDASVTDRGVPDSPAAGVRPGWGPRRRCRPRACAGS